MKKFLLFAAVLLATCQCSMVEVELDDSEDAVEVSSERKGNLSIGVVVIPDPKKK